ncbi:DUF397 domain-containing protein [Streptomyces sp. NPDC059781]|uniref:DUF397 domain-containing protein n=1 Tax=unclassified Streptomyces TaxID=2593676 RepID=UPI0036610396
MGIVGELRRFKSSCSGSEGDSCVEVAFVSEVVHVRDSKAQEGPRFAVSSAAWRDFLGCVER